jgi:hypothetical protein
MTGMRHPKAKQHPDGLTCGCCNGRPEDRCCCWIHQDVPRGIVMKVCSRHDIEEAVSRSPVLVC